MEPAQGGRRRSSGAVGQFLRALQSVPADGTTLRPKIREAVKQHQDALKQLSQAHPIQSDLEKALIGFQVDEIVRQPAEKITALPSAANFPGAVPAKAKRVTKKMPACVHS